MGYMGVKLDLSKAYDRVDWSFLRAILWKMGFGDKFVSLIWEFISTVSYKILLGGREIGSVLSTRGIRQGDPISPYLFILILEVLDSMIYRHKRVDSLHGIKVARDATKVTNLFFADDCYIFCRAYPLECLILKSLIDDFVAAFG